MIPFHTTTITIERPAPGTLADEPYSGEDVWYVTDKGIRASIGTFSRTVSATERVAGGEQTSVVLQLTCDIPASGITHLDRITDDKTGEKYSIHWCFKRLGLGLDHYTAELGSWAGLVS